MFLKRNSKAISLALAIFFCMSFMFAGFATTPAAAASMYQVTKAPTVTPAASGTAQDIGAVVKVTIPDCDSMGTDILTVSFPSEWTFPNNGGVVPVVATMAASQDTDGAADTANDGQVAIVATGGAAATGDMPLQVADFDAAGFFGILPNNCIDIKMAGGVASGADNYFYIVFNGVDLANSAGDLQVSFVGPSGSLFETALNVTIGKSSRSGSTLINIKKVEQVSNDDTLDIITIMENSAGSIDLTGTIKLKILTKGFTWDDANLPAAASYGWAWAGNNFVAGNLDAVGAAAGDLSTDKKELSYAIPVPAVPAAVAAAPGRLSFVGLPIAVDDTVVKAGDECEVQISGASITKTTVTVAKFVDFGLSATQGTPTTVISGHDAVDAGDITIKESGPGSWVDGRTITLGLPSGARWDIATNPDVDVMNSSDIGTINVGFSGDNDEFMKLTLAPPVAPATTSMSASAGAEININDAKIDLAPDFDGPVNVTVTGNAGCTAASTITIANAKPSAAITVAELKNVEIGKPNQKIGDIVVAENAAGGLMNNANPGNEIRLVLDEGYRFAATPTVKVTEGDMIISTSGITVDETLLTIPVKTESTKTASKITISDVYVDAYRTAPEGKVNLKFDNGNSALNEVFVQWPNAFPDKEQIAVCVTPAPGEGSEGAAVGQFKIGSNIYQVNGVSKVMDSAPYVKNDRTYVPVRFMGYAMGLTDADVVWDSASQKATLTKGANKVELTIGSTTIVVNGESKTMDVAPEISAEGRTMLPARFVAENLGFQVGWDAATGTVLISK